MLYKKFLLTVAILVFSSFALRALDADMGHLSEEQIAQAEAATDRLFNLHAQGRTPQKDILLAYILGLALNKLSNDETANLDEIADVTAIFNRLKNYRLNQELIDILEKMLEKAVSKGKKDSYYQLVYRVLSTVRNRLQAQSAQSNVSDEESWTIAKSIANQDALNLSLQETLTLFNLSKQVLEDKNARETFLNKQKKALLLRYHPDKNPEREKWAHEKAQEATAAHETLLAWLQLLPTKSIAKPSEAPEAAIPIREPSSEGEMPSGQMVADKLFDLYLVERTAAKDALFAQALENALNELGDIELSSGTMGDATAFVGKMKSQAQFGDDLLNALDKMATKAAAKVKQRRNDAYYLLVKDAFSQLRDRLLAKKAPREEIVAQKPTLSPDEIQKAKDIAQAIFNKYKGMLQSMPLARAVTLSSLNDFAQSESRIEDLQILKEVLKERAEDFRGILLAKELEKFIQEAERRFKKNALDNYYAIVAQLLLSLRELFLLEDSAPLIKRPGKKPALPPRPIRQQVSSRQKPTLPARPQSTGGLVRSA